MNSKLIIKSWILEMNYYRLVKILKSNILKMINVTKKQSKLRLSYRGFSHPAVRPVGYF